MSRSDASPDMGRPVRDLKPTSALTLQSPQLKGRKTTHGRSAFRFFRRRISAETTGAFLTARIRRLHARRLETVRKIGHKKHEKSQKRKLSFEPLICANLEPQKSAHGKHGIHGRLSRKIGHKKHGNAGRGSALTFVVKAADPLLGLLFGRWDTRERG